MIGCSLWLIAALALAPEDDPRALVGRLGAERFDDRVAAIKALERLGEGALPALREAADSADPRVRSRARDVIESLARKAEAERFSRTTSVRLDFRDRPLGEVVDAMNARDGLGLVLRTGPPMRRGMMFIDPGRPDPLVQLKGRTISLAADAPVPFWQAIDRLCEAASLRYDLTPQPRFGVTEGSLVLMGDRTGRGPVSDSGPFRVQVTRVHAASGRDFAGAPGQGAGVLTVALAVLAEPGLSLHQAGPVKVEEAVDDRGRPLSPQAAEGARSGRNPGGRPSPNQSAGLGSFAVHVALAAPDPPGAVIRRLRGKVPVAVIAREFDPLVIPLNREGAAVTTFQGRYFTFTVDTAAPGREAGTAVTVTARPGRGNTTRGGGTGSRPPNFGSEGVGYDRGQQHLELYDAAGRRLEHHLGGQMRGADNLGFYDRYQFTLGPPGGRRPAGDPAGQKPLVATELRYYEFVQKEVEVPFDFRDVPMP